RRRDLALATGLRKGQLAVAVADPPLVDEPLPALPARAELPLRVAVRAPHGVRQRAVELGAELLVGGPRALDVEVVEQQALERGGVRHLGLLGSGGVRR